MTKSPVKDSEVEVGKWFVERDGPGVEERNIC